MTAHPHTQERPLITFALLSYNQEKYISEAVKSALAQTYEPLEIILSDDCSSDRTFEIMQEMAKSYEGPHRIIIRKQEVNDGLLNHVCAVISNMHGEIIVMAAGDDISSAERVAEVAAAWTPNCLGLFTACDLIDENGIVIEENWVPAGNVGSRLPWLKEINSDLFVYGASSSYHKSVAKKLPKSNSKVYTEDTPLNLIIQSIAGEVLFQPRALVKYRVHSETLSNSNTHSVISFGEIKHEERKQKNRILNRINMLFYLKNILVPSLDFSDHIQLNDIERDIEFCDLRIRWYSLNLIQRVKVFFSCKEGTKLWILPRILGLNIYTALKYASLRFKGNKGRNKEIKS